MDSKRRDKRAWPTAAVLALSLLLHAGLLFLPLPGPRHESPRRDAPTVTLDLLPRPAERAADNPERLPEPEQAPPEPTQRTAEPDSPEPEVAAQSPAKEPAQAEAEPAVAPAPPDTTATADRMQAQLLSAARALGRESERAEDDKGLQYEAAPALPSQPGWLNQYTGPVTASIDRWKGNDGSRSARIVTGSGQVFCIRTRAPTIAETFNPWMSSAVGMVRDCGRERPRAPDGSDPWVRRPEG
ncbi:hypothetical protein [Wenzhouxiangella sediminis]|uniref:Uncharacterized protein n=1 Tax=Wenzhouxiangella sediminis TaxID=1792836 RepID=A0A3E1KCR5_9GAMM|nr:hypothetical protein [Wenzhouxiangella sediminis]RFF32821.1 hypothetical protein DZC52_00350 [Wenzhouxiangella sediminis]